MADYAIVDPNGLVTNIAVGLPALPTGWTAVPYEVGAQIGGTWDGAVFSAAPAPQVIEPTHVALGRLFEHFTDTEQDSMIAATGANALRFKFGVQSGLIVPIERIRPILESSLGATRADELIAAATVFYE